MRSLWAALIAFLWVGTPWAALAQGGTTLDYAGAPVTILRDAYGVPHVFAASRAALFFGDGYAIAEDRLGQMELSRRTARGEMAELVGQSAVAADRETRTDGYTEPERQAQLARLPADLRTAFGAYADGVNAYVAAARQAGVVPQVANFPGKLDLAALRPWSPTDSVAIGQMMARRFGGDEGGELRNMMLLSVLRGRFGKEAARIFDDVAWRNDPASPTTLPGARVRGAHDPWPGTPRTHWGATGQVPARFDSPAARRAADALSQQARLALAERYGLMTKWGSYCIAVSAARSATGAAMLVGGPQMGFRTPSIAHEVHLSGAGIDCIGMSFAGVPGILIGHNPYLAWSTTTGLNDETDVFVETLNPADPYQYRFKGEWRTMTRRTETIAVAGAAPTEVEVCRTVHGPVVQWDRSHHLAYSRGAAYWDRELDTFQAMYQFHSARTAAEFGRACSLITTAHNFLCATQGGDIGYWFCGRTPLRDPRIDPRLPTPGDGSREWRGILPFGRQPQAINPPGGFLANWNNKPSVTWPCFDTPVWGQVQHVARIQALLKAKPRVLPEDLQAIVRDIGTNDATADALLPLLRGAVTRRRQPLSADAARAWAWLAAWDRHATEGSVAATLFGGWLQQVREDLFLGTFGFIQLLGRDMFNTAMQPSLIAHVLEAKTSPVPVLHDYLKGKTPDRVMLDALEKSVRKLARARGSQMNAWGFTRGRTNLSPLPGIPATDRGTYIQIVECSKPMIRGVSILPPGQSERLDSPHVSDQRELASWFFYKPMETQRSALAGK